MLLDLGQVALGLGAPPVVSYALHRTMRAGFYSVWCSSAAGGMIGTLLPPPSLVLAASNGASLILALILWWLSRRRRRRKRAPRAYGAKSRALVADLVRHAREAAKPRPVLRHAPGGARA